MTLGQNPFNPFRSLPTLAAINRRRTELNAYQDRQEAAEPATAVDELPAEQQAYLPEESGPFDDQEEPRDFQLPYSGDAYPNEYPEPSAAPLPRPSAPPPLAEPALYGIAGRIVNSLAPHTEADPAAVLLQFLSAFGNLVGPVPHCRVGATRHGLNLFVVLVGESSKARKGTSWRQISSLFADADPGWVARRVTTARPTAYGIIHALRDQQPATDRRLFLLAEEFASVLHMLGQRTGQLSPLLRCAWDGGDLSVQNGSHLLHATGAHLSLVAHITESELAHHLSRTEAHNGFANRCLWTSVRRSQSLPEGGALPPDQLSSLARELRRTLNWAQSQTEILFRRTPAARKLWQDRYPAFSQGRPAPYV